jgi:L-histidine N-alpha-methyltransferase
MERDLAQGQGVANGQGEPTLLAASRWPAGRLRLKRVDGTPARSFGDEVRAGLTGSPKVLQPKYFYDELGSVLFTAICALPEYYLTRAEAEILHSRAGEIAASLTGPVRLVELGSGDGRKTRLLIDALLARQGRLDYFPIDISRSALEVSSQELLSTYPNLRVTAWVGEYHLGLRAIREQDERRPENSPRRTLALFLGSTIGNLAPEERVALLGHVRGMLAPGDALLLGADLKKDEKVLVAAYDDELGVTAAFDLNVLSRINRELGGGFDLRSFRHLARWNETEGRIEMHLESRKDQTVPIRDLDLEVPFRAGETIHTESSYKFDLDQISALADQTGFALVRTWHDAARRFSSNLLVARS